MAAGFDERLLARAAAPPLAPVLALALAMNLQHLISSPHVWAKLLFKLSAVKIFLVINSLLAFGRVARVKKVLLTSSLLVEIERK